MTITALVLVGCKKPINVSVIATDDQNGSFVLEARTEPDARLVVDGFPSETVANTNGEATIEVPMASLPLGPQHLSVSARGGLKQERVGSTKVAVNRPKLSAKLKLADVASKGSVTLTCGGVFCSENDVHLSPANVVSFRLGASRGSTVQIASARATVGDGRTTLDVPLGGEVLSLDARVILPRETSKPVVLTLAEQEKASAGAGKRMVSIPASVRSADGEKLEGTLDLTVRDAADLRDRLKAVKDAPVHFDAEAPAERPPHALYWASKEEIIGAGSIAEIELIAFEDRKGHRIVGHCGQYVGADPGKTLSIDLSVEDVEYSVRDRRSGKLVVARRFTTNSGACPTVHFGVAGGSTRLGDAVGEGPVRAWLGTLVHARK